MICYWIRLDSPIGNIDLAAIDGGLVYCGSPRESGIDMFKWLEKNLPNYSIKEGPNKILDMAKSQLEAYFSGEAKTLDVPLHLIGTEFYKSVWKALQTIPYGQTRSYGEIARQIGRPKAARPVGQANNRNPISYFVP